MFKYDIGLSAIFCAIAAYVLYESRRFPPSETVGIGPAYWPSFLGVALLVLAAALLAEALIKRWAEKKRERGENAPRAEPEPPIHFGSPGMRCIYLLAAVFAVFGVIVYQVNFLAATVFFVPCCMRILGEKRWPVLAAVTVGVPVAVYVIFTIILRIDLP